MYSAPGRWASSGTTPTATPPPSLAATTPAHHHSPSPPGRALVEATYGIGGLIAVAVWSELGDCRRFSRSQQVVRHSGLDVSVDGSDRHRAHGYLTRQGPPTLRWALFEAAMNASHRRSPDHAYYSAVKDRHDGKLAAISVARQFARRCYHVLRNLDPDVVYAMPA